MHSEGCVLRALISYKCKVCSSKNFAMEINEDRIILSKSPVMTYTSSVFFFSFSIGLPGYFKAAKNGRDIYLPCVRAHRPRHAVKR